MKNLIISISLSAIVIFHSLIAHAQNVSFTASNEVVSLSGNAVVEISVSGFMDVTSVQFTIEWNPSVIEFFSTGNYGLNGLAGGNFGTNNMGNGILTFSWDDPNAMGVSVSDGSTIFTITYAAIGSEGESSAVSFTDVPTPIEVTINFTVVSHIMNDGSITIAPPPSFPDTIYVDIPELEVNMGDSVLVPVNVEFPPDSFYSSAELSFSGYMDDLEYGRIVIESSLAGDADWIVVAQETGNLLITSSAGANDISGSGTLFWLKFYAPSNSALGFVPINIESAIFNNGEEVVIVTNGGVHIILSLHYGDVNLDGQIRAFDASLILKYIAGFITLNPENLAVADVNLDQDVNELDAVIILQYLVGLVPQLPCETCITSLNVSGEITMSGYEITAGESIEVPLVLAESQNIFSINGVISYDNEVLKFDGIRWPVDMRANFILASSLVDSLLEDSLFILYGYDSTLGKIKFIGASDRAIGEDVDTLAVLKFIVKDQKSTSVNLDSLRWNGGEWMLNQAKANLFYTSVDDKAFGIPTEYRLSQNYPNPFNPATVIKYSLPKTGEVRLLIFNIKGEEVVRLVNEVQSAGKYEMLWEADIFSSGIYFYRFTVGDFTQTKKMVLLK